MEKKKKVGQTVICCLEKQLKSRKMHFWGRNFRHPIILLCKRDFPAETSNTKAAQTTKPPRTAASAASLGTQTTRAGPTPHLSLEEWPFHRLPPGATCPQLSMLKGSTDFPATVNSWIWWTSEIPYVCVFSQKEILPGICHDDAIQKAPRKVIIIHWTINVPARGAGRHVIPAEYRDALL